jgi:hypothetical protein
MFEHRREKLISRRLFYRRLAGYGAISLGFVLVSLAIGVLGYRLFEGMSWIDAFVNAAMILGGMGPVGELHTNAGKLFAGFYALYSGLVAIIAVGFLAAPIFHRFLHHFHVEVDKEK